MFAVPLGDQVVLSFHDLGGQRVLLFDLLAYYWPVAEASDGVLVVCLDGIGAMVLFRRALDYYADVFGVEKSAIMVLGC